LAFENAKAIPKDREPIAQYFRVFKGRKEGEGAGKNFPPCPGKRLT
jgi:hypothetical protein